MENEFEYQETAQITFEWTLHGLRQLFDSTKGELKSKATKSARFGDGRWQILFYPNSGTSKDSSSDGGYVSLYLSCEPTAEEKEAAMADGGRWVREGVYKFSFELRSLGKILLHNPKEANNHTFSHKTANWGWAQFAKRDSVYYQSSVAKAQDAIIIICTITSSASPPAPLPTSPRLPIPKDLIETVGSLLNDSTYSDVEFVIPRRGQGVRSARRIWASRKMLRRAEYFNTMFSSNFVEGDEGTNTPKVASEAAPSLVESDFNLVMTEFEDSDDEDDALDDALHEDAELQPDTAPGTHDLLSSLADVRPEENEVSEQEERNVRAKLSHPSSPRSSYAKLLTEQKPSKLTVVVKDVAYATYYALLYYLYTDTIVFAPLSSSFASIQSSPLTLGDTSLSTSESQEQLQVIKNIKPDETVTSRREWIKKWQAVNPGRPAPCSAKAIYRLADRLNLDELKERASRHILKSLTVDNIAYEVFSPFAAAFDEIREVQVKFFLHHWQDIRSSESMRAVWQQIRNGRHPGFEEVWPVIAQSLEFVPSPKS